MSDLASVFDRDGFALAKGVFDGDMLTAMTEDFDRIVEQLEASGEDINARWDAADADRPRRARRSRCTRTGPTSRARRTQ